MQVTTQQFEDVITTFVEEMETATPERMVELLEVIETLVQEQKARGL